MEPTDQRTGPVRQRVALAAFLVVALAAGAAGRWWRGADAAAYYRSLPLPEVAPAPELYTPVSVVLYVLIGVSAWLVWRRWGWTGSRGALNLWLLQLLLTGAWAPVFLGLRDTLLALIVAVLLLLAVIATVTAFWRRSRPAAWLLVPHALWVGFGTYVNGVVWWNLS